jgi:hypothetical protein
MALKCLWLPETNMKLFSTAVAPIKASKALNPDFGEYCSM